MAGSILSRPESTVAGNVESACGSAAHGVWWLDRIAEPHVAFLFLLAFGVAIFVLNLGGFPIYTRGEPREAIRIVDIVNGGGLLLPTQTGIGLPWKPPLMYWLGALISVLAGVVDEWTVRLPSATLAVAGVAVCYYYVGRLFDRRSALVAALILATSFEYLQAASAARVDMTLTFFMEVAFFEFLLIAEGLVSRRMLLYLALAAAILSKGPIGAFLPGLVALIWMLLVGRLRLLKDLKLPSGAAVVAIVAGGWYLLAGLKGGMDFVHRQILDENLYRLFPSHAVQEPHAHRFYYMELMLIAGFMPWSVIVPVAIVQLVHEPRTWSPRVKYLMV
jgi:4-amino-4-deoxy-L-arabinose transferase-like glycosyltransferase